MAAQDYVRALCPVHVTNRKDAWNIAEVTRIRGNKVVDKEIKMGNRLTGYARGRCVLSANEVLKIAPGWNLRVWPQSAPGRDGRNMGGANR